MFLAINLILYAKNSPTTVLTIFLVIIVLFYLFFESKIKNYKNKYLNLYKEQINNFESSIENSKNKIISIRKQMSC